MNSGGGLRTRLGISGLGGRGRAIGDRSDGLVAHRRHGLVLVSRMMPGSAGRRWLAEAESVLWDIAAALWQRHARRAGLGAVERHLAAVAQEAIPADAV
jgi:hypothetical protein